jgi:HD superfamily phosphodiesterase
MLTEQMYLKIRESILGKLSTELAPDLLYHCLEHTIDVETQAERIARNEHRSEAEIRLIKLACLYHDTGFLTTYAGHELAGCSIARKELAEFGLEERDISSVCGMIMATRIPQTPTTKLEEIICDADLDYLGREDFWPISKNLFRELQARNMINSENDWNLVQIKFFHQHTYFTDTTRVLREPGKLKHLEMISEMVQ